MEENMLISKHFSVCFSNVHTKTITLVFHEYSCKKKQFSTKHGYSFSPEEHGIHSLKIHRQMQLVLLLCTTGEPLMIGS